LHQTERSDDGLQPEQRKVAEHPASRCRVLALVAEQGPLEVVDHAARSEAVLLDQPLERQGVDLRARLVTGLQSFFGKRSQELRQFGIDPLLPAVRRRREEGEQPQPLPAEAGVEA
jgi:hypothetical protein